MENWDLQKVIKYKGFNIVADRLLGYSLYKGCNWYCSDHKIEDLQKTVDLLLSYDHLNWQILYIDIDEKIIHTISLEDCSVVNAESVAKKNKPKNTINYMILEIIN